MAVLLLLGVETESESHLTVGVYRPVLKQLVHFVTDEMVVHFAVDVTGNGTTTNSTTGSSSTTTNATNNTDTATFGNVGPQGNQGRRLTVAADVRVRIRASLAAVGLATASEMEAAVLDAVTNAHINGTLNDLLQDECECTMGVTSLQVEAARDYPSLIPTISNEPTAVPSSPPTVSFLPTTMPTVHCAAGYAFDRESNECIRCPVGTYALNASASSRAFAHNCTRTFRR